VNLPINVADQGFGVHFIFVSILGGETNCNIGRRISLNGSNSNMYKGNKLFSQGSAFEAFSKDMEKATCDPKGGDTLSKR